MNNKITSGFILRSILIGLIVATAVLLTQAILFNQSPDFTFSRSVLQNEKRLKNTENKTQFQQAVSYSSAVKTAAPAVVNVYSARIRQEEAHPLLQDPTFKRFFGEAPAEPESPIDNNLGSGVILDGAGLILTNAHVIKNADQVRISLQDGRQAFARVVGTDSDTDLAVLKINLENLPVIPIGDSSRLEVGDVVLAIGNPYDFGQTVTQGIVSATGRSSVGITTFEDFIQTDADINPGNSGGALIDAYGRLIGINTAIISKDGGGSGIGFATPIDLALDVTWQLLAYGKVVRGWLGIEAQALSEDMKKQTGLSSGGVFISGVLRQGPAHQAGLMPGDIITHIANQPVFSPQQAIQLISQIKPGSVIDILVQRGWDEFMVKAKVIQRPKFKS